MRILLYNDSDVFAGTERHILDLAVALRGAGVDVVVACPLGSPLALQASGLGIDALHIAKHGKVDFTAIQILTRLAYEHQIDLIHAHNGRTHLAAAMAISRAGRGGVVATQHFLSPTRTRRRGIRSLMSRVVHRYIDRRTSHTIAISRAVRDAMIARGDTDPSKVTVVHNGYGGQVEPDERSNAGEEVRRELRLAADAKIVFCAARLQSEKGLSDLLDAMVEVKRREPAAICLIAGEGDLRNDLERQIQERGLQQAVRLLGFRNDIPSLMRAADLFVLPSPAEPFGLVLLEAMAARRAVIAMRAGGPVEIVDDGVTGLLVQPHDAADLARAILKLLGDSDLRNRMGESAAKRLMLHFSAARMAEETLAVYKHVLEGVTAPQVDVGLATPATQVVKP